MAMKSNTIGVNLKRRSAMRGRRNGNSIIEMVFAMQLLMFICMGMVEFGQFFYIKHAFEAAARDAARGAILATASWTSATNNTPYNAAQNTLLEANVTIGSGWLTITDLGPTGTSSNVVTSNNVTTVAAGDILQVQLSTTYNLIPNVLRPLYAITGGNFGIKNGKVMMGQCTMVRE